MISKSANALEHYRKCFGHLSEESHVFSRVLYVLEAVASSKSGLGEVMQDYALQASNQLRDILNAGQNVMSARQSEKDMAILYNSSTVMKTINRFLELTPAAMRRNNAEAIGKKEKITIGEVEELHKAFSGSIETKLLLTYETPEDQAYIQQAAQANTNIAH